jgi:hypothetical protein
MMSARPGPLLLESLTWMTRRGMRVIQVVAGGHCASGLLPVAGLIHWQPASVGGGLGS